MMRLGLVCMLALVVAGCDNIASVRWGHVEYWDESTMIVLDPRVPDKRPFCIEEVGANLRCVTVVQLRELIRNVK